MQFCSAPSTETGRPFRDGNTRQKKPPKNFYGGTDSSGVRECFREYSLQDQMEALQKMMVHTEKHVGSKEPKFFIEDPRDKVGVKECLNPEKRTAFGTVIWELRNTVMNSYWNKEVGKTRYQLPNLPVGMDLVNTTFGKKTEIGCTVAELLKPKTMLKEGLDRETVHKMYRLSHQDYNPSERMTRNYNAPFDAKSCFGKKGGGKADGSRLRSRLYWPIDEAPADDWSTKKNLDINITHGKPTVTEDYGAPKAIYEYFANEKELCLQRYLQHLNTLRLRFKKRWPEIPFLDVYQDLIDLDAEFEGILPEDTAYNVLAKYKMSVDKALFTPLLDLLKLRENGNVRHRELVDLLNWKCDIPTLPKLSTMPVEYQHYNTAYGDEIGVPDTMVKQRAAGLPSSRWDLSFVCNPKGGIRCDREHLGDQTKAYSLITPSIFTRHNLSHIDFFKTRSKQEIRSIFANIGVELTDDSFETLWEEAVKRDGNGGVCVETFRDLVSRRKDIVESNNTS